MSHYQIAPLLLETAHLIRLDEVERYPGNPRLGDKDEIKRSLRTHGQYTPILVSWQSKRIVKGNNTHLCMAEEGWTHCAANFIEVDPDEELRILAVDNATSDRAAYDPEALLEVLTQIAETERWEGSGFDEQAYAELRAQIEGVAVPDMSGVAAPDQEPEPMEAPEVDMGPAQTEAEVEEPRTREIVVVVPEAEYGQTLDRIAALQKAWNLTGVGIIVAEALRRAAEEL